MPKAPHFPDFSANYQKTVVMPAQEALQAQQQAEAQLEAEQQAEAAQAAAMQATQGYKLYVYNYESGNNPGAVNRSSGACGLGQALPCSKMPCSLDDYICQDNFFTGYMSERYGSWYNAYLQEITAGWW